MAKDKSSGVIFGALFSFEKETPGTYRFKEDGDETTIKIGTLYVKKSSFPKGPPKRLEVTVHVPS